MRVFSGIDELERAIGSDAGVSSWVTIDQARIDAFADATGDRQWIHVDPERAASGPFGATIAHGYLTLSLASLFLDEVMRIEGAAMMVNYGTDRVRFPAPVVVGSRLRGWVHLAELATTERGRLLRSHVTIEIDGAEKPACVADVLTLLPSAP